MSELKGAEGLKKAAAVVKAEAEKNEGAVKGTAKKGETLYKLTRPFLTARGERFPAGSEISFAKGDAPKSAIELGKEIVAEPEKADDE